MPAAVVVGMSGIGSDCGGYFVSKCAYVSGFLGAAVSCNFNICAALLKWFLSKWCVASFAMVFSFFSSLLPFLVLFLFFLCFCVFVYVLLFFWVRAC